MSIIKLYHGDCLTEMNKIADKSIDMILCDLPYGTTACINTKRNFIGIELDDNYFKIAEDRINKAKESIFDI